MKCLWLMVTSLVSFCAYAQVPVFSSDELYMFRQAIVQTEIMRYLAMGQPCPCPFSIARDGNICGESSLYSRTGGVYPICYTSQVTPELINAYRLQGPEMGLGLTGSSGLLRSYVRPSVAVPQPSGVVTGLLPHQPFSHLIQSPGITASSPNFVFNGVIYHPLEKDSCDRIMVGTPLAVVNVPPVTSERFTSTSIVFRLPDGSRCLAMALGRA